MPESESFFVPAAELSAQNHSATSFAADSPTEQTAFHLNELNDAQTGAIRPPDPAVHEADDSSPPSSDAVSLRRWYLEPREPSRILWDALQEELAEQGLPGDIRAISRAAGVSPHMLRKYRDAVPGHGPRFIADATLERLCRYLDWEPNAVSSCLGDEAKGVRLAQEVAASDHLVALLRAALRASA